MAERLSDLYRFLLERKATMPESSSTTKLLREGPLKIVEKCTEELGEALQALLEEDDSQVNLEISQAIYNLMVLMVACGKGNIESVQEELERRNSSPGQLPKTLGLAMRNCAQSMGRACSILLAEMSSGEETNSRVADVIYNFQSAMQLAQKGSWEGVLEKI